MSYQVYIPLIIPSLLAFSQIPVWRGWRWRIRGGGFGYWPRGIRYSWLLTWTHYLLIGDTINSCCIRMTWLFVSRSSFLVIQSKDDVAENISHLNIDEDAAPSQPWTFSSSINHDFHQVNNAYVYTILIVFHFDLHARMFWMTGMPLHLSLIHLTKLNC